MAHRDGDDAMEEAMRVLTKMLLRLEEVTDSVSGCAEQPGGTRKAPLPSCPELGAASSYGTDTSPADEFISRSLALDRLA